MDRRGSEAARAAWLYYVEEFTQGEVARELRVSRSTVVRLLRRAKETGLVRITLDVPQDVFEMERELERLYGLERVRLVPDAGDGEKLKRWLALLLASALWGFAFVAQLPEIARLLSDRLSVDYFKTLTALRGRKEGSKARPVATSRGARPQDRVRERGSDTRTTELLRSRPDTNARAACYGD